MAGELRVATLKSVNSRPCGFAILSDVENLVAFVAHVICRAGLCGRNVVKLGIRALAEWTLRPALSLHRRQEEICHSKPRR